MSIPINIESSIRYNRIVYQWTSARVLDLLLQLPFRIFLVLIYPLGLFLFASTESPSPWIKPVMVLILFVPTVLMFSGVYFAGLLVRVQGVKADQDRVALERLLQEYHPEFRWHAEMTEGVDVRDRYILDNRLVFIRQDGDVYINFATLGRGDMVLLSFSLLNYSRCRRVRKRFQEYLTA